MNFNPYQYTLTGAKPHLIGNLYVVVKMLCMVALTTSLCYVAQAYVQDLRSRIKPEVKVVPEPVKSEVTQCTSDQAIQWWTGTKDLNAARAKMCGTKINKGKSK